MGIGDKFHRDTKYHPEQFGYSLSFKVKKSEGKRFKLTKPKDLVVDLTRIIDERRSRRSFGKKPISFEDLSTVLWCSLGISRYHYRVFPSAGALYATEGYVVSRDVEKLPQGLYHYIPSEHALDLISEEDILHRLSQASLFQEWISDAQSAIVLTAVVERMKKKYGERGYRYIYMEAGHIGQNIYLVCEALGLGTCAIGAFFDDSVANLIGVSASEEIPVYIYPLGTR